jgi:hypothetical protein
MVLLTIRLLALAISPVLAAAPAPEPAARAISVAGQVSIRKSAQAEAAGHALRSGDAIFADDVIKTSGAGSLKLLFSDKTVLDLGPSSLFRVNEYKLKGGDDREVTMSLDYGKIRAAVNTPVGAKGKFLIRTKTTTMGVRGTEFVVASDLKAGTGTGAGQQSVKTEITVVHGLVEVTDRAAPPGAPPVAVGAGKQLVSAGAVSGERVLQRSSASAAPQVVDVPPAQMKSIVAEAKVEDKTFKQAVVVDTSGGSSGSGGGQSAASQGGGSMTVAAIREAVQNDSKPANNTTTNAPPPPKPPGYFEAGTTAAAPQQPNLQGQPIRLRVVLNR